MIATIASIFFRPIKLVNSGILPRIIDIPACKDENKPVLFHLDDGAYFRYILDGQSARIPIPGPEIARSIVADFHRHMLDASVANKTMPGVMAIDSKVDILDPKLLKELQENQNRWKEAIVRKADIDWSRVKNPALINGMQIEVARSLKLNKEWAADFEKEKYTECPACYGRINAKATICMHCKTDLTKKG